MTSKFLVNLIEKSTRVILPEFGAFLIKDDGSGNFKPENITFSPFLRYNDGVVEDELSSLKKISKDKAKEEITEFIESLKKELLEKKTFELEGLGFLLIDQRGSIHFSVSGEKGSNKKKAVTPPASEVESKSTEKKVDEPTEVIELINEDPIEIPVIEQTSKEEIIVIDEESIPAPIVDEIPKKKTLETNIPLKPMTQPKAPIKKQKQKSESKNSSSGTGKAILTGTLIGLGFVILLASGWYLYDSGIINFKDKKESKDINFAIDKPVDTDKLSSEPQTGGKFDDEFSKLSAEMDDSSKSDQKSTDKTPEKRIAKTESIQDSKVNVTYPKEGVFHVIAGSFRNVEYAEKLSAELKVAGYSSKVIKQPSGMYAVTLGSFINREQASESMNKWKPQHPNIWILQQ
jgi:cell division protein FtsN/nucleoid DNA-binding protein